MGVECTQLKQYWLIDGKRCEILLQSYAAPAILKRGNDE
jgi:hypothetical protein